MASPTRWLRKNSKIIMVFVAVFAMAIFGLGPVVDQMTGGSRDRDAVQNETVATWRGGKITQADIATWYRKHFQTQRFLRAVNDQARELAGDDFKPLAQLLPPLALSDRASQSAINSELINQFLLAQAAKDEGVIIGDGVVDAYIDMISGSAGFSRNDLMQINRNANQRVSLESIYSQLKMELAARQMRSFSLAGFQQFPNPTEAAELYQKSTEAIELEIYPVPVEQFIDQVAVPAESELKALFDKGRHQFADPTGKRPGFKKPNELAIQYVYADFDTMLTNHLNRLTDEEVQAEYDRLVAEKSNIVIQRIPKTTSDPSEGESEDDAPRLPGEDDGETELTEEVESGESAGSSEEGQGGDPEQSSQASESGGVGESGDASETGESGAGESGALGEDAESIEDFQDFSLDDFESSLEFVSFVQEETFEKAQTSETQESKDDTSNETPNRQDDETLIEDNQTDATQETADPPSDTSQSTTDAAEPTAPLDQDIEAMLERLRSGQGESLFADDQEFEERVLPLVEVADRVKRSMVIDKVRIEMSEKMERALNELVDYNIQISVWETLDNKQAVDKPSLDIDELKSRYNLIYDEIPLSDFEALQKTDFGQISFSFQDEMGRFQSTSLAELIFIEFDEKKEFDPQQADDMLTGNSYIYWVTEKSPASVVTFEQAKDRVEEFWRNQQARELALKEAENKAAVANSKEQYLSEIFGDGASRTGEFTWLSLSGRGRFGMPFGVEEPGEEFMRAAFALQPKQAAVAVNANRSIVYVVQMVGDRRAIEDVGMDFVNNRLMTTKQIPFETQQAASLYNREVYFEWVENLRDQMGLRMER